MHLLAVVALVALGAPALAQCQLDELAAFDGAQGDNLGFAIASSADRVLVGARFDDVLAVDSGSAYVFARSGAGFAFQGKLTPGDGGLGDAFGSAVALDGDLAVIGAPLDDDLGFDAGAVYVFESVAGSWLPLAKLTAPDGASGDRFGAAVAVAGDRIAVGAALDSHAVIQGGSVYLFERGPSGFFGGGQQVVAGDAAPGDQFGHAVALSGPWLAVGAHLDDGLGASTNTGTVYLFQDTPLGWAQTDALRASDAAVGDFFGFSVALDGDLLVAGAHQDDDAGANSGSVYVFERLDGIWLEVQKLVASDGAAGDQLGFAVALDATRVLAGAPFDDDDGISSGAAYAFRRLTDSAPFLETGKLTAADGSAGANLGLAVGVAGDLGAAGAHFAAEAAVASGSAYVFALAGLAAPLSGCPGAVSVSGGGTNAFALDAGPGFANLPYLLVGSLSGTSPGLQVSPHTVLPLNLDAYLVFSANAPNAAPLTNSFGVFDANGRASATFALAPGSSGLLVGKVAHHAFLVIRSTPTLIELPFASNATSVLLLP